MKTSFSVIALIALSGSAFAQNYVIRKLEQLPEVGAGFNGSIGAPLAINDEGQIAGYSYLNGVPISHAMIWYGTTPTDLGTLGIIGSSSIARGINNKGQVVGWSGTSESPNHATTWNGTTPTDLGTLGGTYSEATAINNAGEVVGDSWLVGNTADHATIWKGTTPTDLGTLFGGVSGAFGINAAGHIVGYSYTADNETSQATVWSGTTVTVLNTLGGANGVAVAINRSGQVVGYSDTAGGATHATLWNGIKATDLGTLGMPLSEANDINDAGQIVGAAYSATGPATAVLWRDGAAINLNTLVAGPLAVHVTLNQATAINNHGSIVGLGTDNSTGLSFGFLLRPVPVPLAALLQEVTGVGPGTSLADKVIQAQAYYAASDTQATCAVLTGFVNEVQAQDGKQIPKTLDAKLVADADAIDVAIGCN